MAKISDVKLPNNTTYDIGQSTNIEFIRGTQTATTGNWTGVTTDSELYDGKMIMYYLPFAGSGNATLNLTLADGTTTGAKNCYWNSATRLTTHMGQNQQFILIYHTALKLSDGNTYEGWWVAQRDADSVYGIRHENGRVYAGATKIKPYSLIFLDNANKFSTLTTAASTVGVGTDKTINTSGKYKLPPVIYYYNANNTAAADALVSSTYAVWQSYHAVDIRYSSNYTTAFTTNSPVWIECTIDSNGYWSPTTTAITQTLTSGKYYIYLGVTYSTAYQVSISSWHPVYYYDGTNLTDYTKQVVATYGYTKNTGTVTGTGTSGYLAKWNGTSSLTNGPQLGSSTTTYLRNDGSWATPTDTNYYHTTGSWNGLTYTATANGGAGALALTIPTGTTSTTVALGNHIHATSIATSSGTNQLTLAFGTKYALTAGGTSYVFTMPANPNTNTTYTLTNALASHKYTWTLTPSSGTATTTTVELVAGSNITLTDDTTNKKITIAGTANNAVSQSASTTSDWRNLLMHYTTIATPTTAVPSATNVVYGAVGIAAQPSTGTLRASIYRVADNVELQYNSATEALDFVFL